MKKRKRITTWKREKWETHPSWLEWRKKSDYNKKIWVTKNRYPTGKTDASFLLIDEGVPDKTFGYKRLIHKKFRTKQNALKEAIKYMLKH
jgi:hypothetical protein